MFSNKKILKDNESKSNKLRTVVLCFILVTLYQSGLWAQVINNNGATITILSGTVVGTTTISNTSGTVSNVGTLNATTVTNSATLTNDGSLNATTVTNSSALSGNGTYNIGGSFTNTGTFTAGTSTVVFNGAGAQTIPSLTYYHLQTATGGTKTAGGALTVGGDLTIGPGSSLSASTFTHSLSGNWINNGTFTGGTSTITFAGAADAAITGATTFYQLTLNKSASTNILTLNNNISVATINMTSGEIYTGANSVTITTTRTGSGYIYGTITRIHAYVAATSYAFESPNNTITFNTITGGSITSVTVNVVLSAPGDFPFGGSTNRTYTHTITNTGTYSATLRLHYLDAGLNGNSESTMALWKYNGSIWASKGKSANDATNNWVEQSGITDITNRWCLSDDQNVVRWNGSASSAWGTAGNWTVLQGSASTPPAATDVVSLGGAAFTNQPSITTAVSVKSVQFGSSQAVTLTIGGGGSLSTSGNIDGTWSANANHTIAVGAQTLNVSGDIILSDGTSNHTIGLTIGTGAISITGSLTETGGANVTFSGAGTLGIGTDFLYTSGTFTAGTSTVTYNGTSSQVVAPVTYYNLTINKTSGTASTSTAVTVGGALSLSASTSGILSLGAALSVTGDVSINSGTTLKANSYAINVGGNWNTGGTFTAGTSTVTLNGSGSQNIAASPFNNLTINKSGGTASLTGNIALTGNLAVSSGTLDLASSTANGGGSGTISLGSGTTLRLSGSNNFPTSYSTYSLNSASTVDYYGTGTQTVSTTAAFGNLSLTNGGASAKTLSGSLSCANLLINSGATLDGGAATLDVQGNWTNSGTFTASTGTIKLSGSSKILTGATTFNNLNVTGSYTPSNDIVVNSTMSVTGGTYTAGTTTTTFSGSFTNTGTFTTTGTVVYNGSSAQTLVALSYNNLTLSNTGVKTFATGTSSIAGTVSISGGAADATTNSPTIIFNGSSLQTVPALTFYKLTINNSSGISLAGNIAVNNLLTLTSGNITTNANIVSIPAAGSVSRTSGQIVGNLQRTIATGSNTYKFDVGTSTSYTPVSVQCISVTVGGNLTASVTSGQEPHSGSPVNTAKDVNVYWTLTNAGITLASYTPTFTYNAGDILGGATQSSFILGEYSSSAWSAPTPVTNGSSPLTTFVPGLTTFGNFVVGQAFSTITDYFKSQASGNWSTASNWLSSPDNSTWGLSTVVPTSSATSITIQNPNTVTVDLNNQTASSLIIANGSTLTNNGGNNFSVTGNWTNNGGTFNPQTGTVTFTGNNAAINGTAAVQTFNNIIVNKTSGQTLTVGGSTATLNVGGTFTETSGNFTAPASMTVTGTTTLTAGTLTAGSNLTVNSDWTNDGATFTPGSGTVTFNGSATQNIDGSVVSQTFNNMTISGSGGVTLGGSTTALTITGATTIATATNLELPFGCTLTCSSSGSVTTQGTGIIILDDGSNYFNLTTSAPTIQTQTTFAGSEGWRMIAAPNKVTVGSMFADPFATQGFTGSTYPLLQPNLLWWDETSQGTSLAAWNKPSASGDFLKAGRGYMFYIFDGADLADASDNYNDGLPLPMTVVGAEQPLLPAFDFGVTATTRSSSSHDTLYVENSLVDYGWNLVGNPTPNTINWNASGWTKTNIDGTIYIWDPADTSGGYSVWNGTTGTNNIVDGLIAPFQAFWVKANAASPILKCDNGVKTTGGNFLGKISAGKNKSASVSPDSIG
jgi:fibronectin-binding autotransporter adhesin